MIFDRSVPLDVKRKVLEKIDKFHFDDFDKPLFGEVDAEDYLFFDKSCSSFPRKLCRLNFSEECSGCQLNCGMPKLPFFEGRMGK